MTPIAIDNTQRREAWDAFKAAPVPARTAVETWRRMDFDAWALDGLAPDDLRRAAGGGRPSGPTPATAGSGTAPAAGIVVSTIEEALKTHPRLVEPRLALGLASPDFRKMEAANLAGFSGGTFLLVPKGTRAAEPIELSFPQAAGVRYSFPRALVVVEDGAEACVVEEHSGSEGAGKASSVAFSRLVVGRGAKVKYYYAQTLPRDTAHFWHQEVELAADCLLQHYSVLLGASVHKSELVARLSGRGARSELCGIAFAGGSQQFDPHTTQWHEAERTRSDLLFRVAVQERARAIYTGLIRIEKTAVGCDAYQKNDNLILAEGARADTTPVLEILTDDVRCKHGATMGPPSLEELFYLGCRGLDPKEAAKMLVMGFFDPILQALPLERLRERLPADIEGRLVL